MQHGGVVVPDGDVPLTLVLRPEVLEDIDPPRFDEPDFDGELLEYYRDIVVRMTAEAAILPGMGTMTGLLIRRLARDYVTGLAADKNVPGYKRNERDIRMMQSFRLMMDQASRADLEHALRTEFVIGLVNEVMIVLDAEVADKDARIRLKELLSERFVTYTESMQGRIAH